AGERSEAAGLRNGRGQLDGGRPAGHRRLDDRVADAEELGQPRLGPAHLSKLAPTRGQATCSASRWRPCCQSVSSTGRPARTETARGRHCTACSQWLRVFVGSFDRTTPGASSTRNQNATAWHTPSATGTNVTVVRSSGNEPSAKENSSASTGAPSGRYA